MSCSAIVKLCASVYSGPEFLLDSVLSYLSGGGGGGGSIESLGNVGQYSATEPWLIILGFFFIIIILLAFIFNLWKRNNYS